MSKGIENRVTFGVRNEEFEKVGAGSSDRYAGEDGLIAGVARAVKLVITARERKVAEEQKERALALLRDAVGQLFGEFEVDATAIESATGFVIQDTAMSYNSLHISVRNSDYVAPITTTYTDPNGAVITNWDWTGAHGREFIDVTPQDILANPSLGLELVVHNDFHL